MDSFQRLAAGDLVHLAPELTLVISAVLLSVIDLLLPRQRSRSFLGWLTLAALIVSAVFTAGDLAALNMVDARTGTIASSDAVQLLGQSYRVDDFASFMKLLLLGGTALIVLMSIGSVKPEDIPHVGEYYYLYLPAVLGGMVMASSGDLITLFVGLELLSITSYVLVGIRKKRQETNEASFKYVVMGGISSAIMLYGMSFLYGISGSTNLGDIQKAVIGADHSMTPLLYVSFFLLLAGFGFKIAAAPFHTWVPDVYQGAASPVTAFLAVVSKGAAFALTFRVLYNLYGTGSSRLTEDVLLSIGVLAAVTMVVGNVAALRQNNMKRLLAFSGVANTGYLLVPLASNFTMFHYGNVTELLFYLLAYLLMTIGAIAVLIAVSGDTGNEEISAFAGLYYRAPWTAVAMVVFLLSLAGLPVTAGFFGKLFILFGTLQTQNYWLPAIMVVTSVISYYYYFGVIRQMFMRATTDAPVRASVPQYAAIWLCALMTVLLGLFPHIVLGYLNQVLSLTQDFFIR
ncbi:NADH-quinone oxidoreductase subunit N [Paenibacillus sp. y28]|uniref:NADH-quinone oxidoreductase subunit N n=1 Tax=Paenibacillus sp. y28 TaxID=3129110 RepID=UPI00301B5C40